MMSDGVVSIGDGKSGSESSPSSKRRGSTGTTNAPTAPVPANRVKRSPQGSAAGESSTKGSERDDMEEVSNEEGQCHGCDIMGVLRPSVLFPLAIHFLLEWCCYYSTSQKKFVTRDSQNGMSNRC